MKKNILVTGVGGRSVGAGLLHSLARTEARERWNVVATDADPFSWGLYQVSARELLPFASSDDYLPRLLDVVARRDIHAIVPGTQAEVDVLTRARDALPIPVVANRCELVPLMMDKQLLARELARHGIPHIETFPLDEWQTVADRHGFPLLLKPAVDTGASRGVLLVASADELLEFRPRLDSRLSYCVQPYVGSAEDEYTAGVLTDATGALIDSIVMRRKLVGLSLLTARQVGERRCAISTGYSQGFIVRHPVVQRFCEELAVRLGSIGPLNVQLRLVDGAPHVFEVHPRFSGTTPIRADVGFNEVDILLRNILHGETFGRLSYRSDVAAIRAFEHVIVPMADMAGHA